MKLKGIAVFYNQQKEEIKRISLLKAPFKEHLIKQKSIELFNESEPCIIYRTACINKLGLEMQDFLNKSKIKHENIIDISEEGIWNNIELPSDVKYVSFI